MLLAGTQFLCFGEYLLYKSGDNYRINSCETIEMFYNLRIDLDKIKYAAHITKIIQDITNENENSYKVLQLFLNTLYVISETDKNMDFILSIFKLKLLCILGFKPRIEECTTCGQKTNLTHFSIKDNGVKCIECFRVDKSAISITPSTYTALKYITSAPSKKLYNFTLKDQSLKELQLLTQLYFNEKLEKQYTLDPLW